MKKKSNSLKRRVVKHLKGDIASFKKEAREDRSLIKEVSKKHHSPKKKRSVSKSPRSRSKVEKVMHEFKEGALHSGSKKGPVVKSRKQAIAIALSEARRLKKRK